MRLRCGIVVAQVIDLGFTLKTRPRSPFCGDDSQGRRNGERKETVRKIALRRACRRRRTSDTDPSAAAPGSDRCAWVRTDEDLDQLVANVQSLLMNELGIKKLSQRPAKTTSAENHK